MLFLCLLGAFLNIIIGSAFSRWMGLPLYLDTILTVTVTLLCGVFWGVITGAFTNLIAATITFGAGGWEGYLFVLCNIATALVTWLFVHFFPRELNLGKITPEDTPFKSRTLSKVMDRMIVLALLSFGLCIAMSVLGGLIAAAIRSFRPAADSQAISPITSTLMPTMFGHNLPVILEEILSRIPVNIIDRLISVFAGYGIALAARGLLNKTLDKCRGFTANHPQRESPVRE
jgi:hypothetical protein